ncbi:MAG: type II secretion system protein [Planctomycetota bacterium]
MRTHSITSRPARGFTLVELIAVLTLVGILSAVAFPALSALDDARDAALINEVERRLWVARTSAMSTGLPTGVRFDIPGNDATTWRLREDAGGIERVIGAGGDSAAPLGSLFRGGGIASFAPIEPGGDATAWFDYMGRPHARSADGTTRIEWTDDAVVTMLDERRITIRRLTGSIER